jgi:outer membrane protein OmpU
MKKVLFATTALVATAGMAAADVSLSGSAEMGLVGASANNIGVGAGYADTTTFLQSVDVRFTMVGESDNGLSFGATIDLDDLVDTGADPVDVAGDFADFTVFITNGFGTLTMGDTDGALDWAMQEVNIGSPGSIADNETGHAGYSGNSGLDGFSDFDGQVLRYNYSVGGFGFAVSAEKGDGIDEPDDVLFGVGFRYGFDFGGGNAGIGIGYQSIDDAQLLAGNQGADILGVSLSIELDSGFSAAFNYSEIDGTGTRAAVDGEHMAIGASYTFDAITVHANYGEYDWAAGSGVADADGYGLAASYNLGGGVTAHLGYGRSSVVGLPSYSDFSLGLAMSF